MAFAWATLALFVHLAFGAQTGAQIPQARLNLSFVRNASFSDAFSGYDPAWPPLYPCLLWVLDRAGIPPLLANELLVVTAAVLLWRLARRAIPGIHPAVPVGLTVVAQANYWNLHWIVSEALLVPLSLATALALLRFSRRPDWGGALWAAVALSAACLTRTFALFWLVPAAAAVFWTRRREVSAALAKLLAAAAIVIVPTALWMMHAYRTTGFLTGRDRTGRRDFNSLVHHWNEATGFDDNLWFSLKTAVTDLLSPFHQADHPFVDAPWQPGAVEWLCLGAALAGVAAIVARRLRGGLGVVAGAKRLFSEDPSLLPAQWVFAYFAWTVALWTGSNNDPIYTRFLYPSYVFIVTAACAAYARIGDGDRLQRVGFQLLAGVYVCVQLWKTLSPLV